METSGQSERQHRMEYAERCKALGIRPRWEREFGYFPVSEPDHACLNARLAAAYPVAALEHARDDDAFQLFIAKAVAPAK